MVRQASELKTTTADFAAAGLGEGVLTLKHILNAPDEICNAGRIFAHASLPAGAWVGPHAHTGETEIYYYLSGEGEYYDDGTIVKVGPGMTTKVLPGQKHGLKNTGAGPLEYICLILNMA